MPPKQAAVRDPQPATSSTSSSESEDEESSGSPPPQQNSFSKKPKLDTPSSVPPPQSEDEDESSDGEEDSDEQDDDRYKIKPTQVPNPSADSSESESEEEPNPEKPPARAAADPTVKPINSKPLDNGSKSKKPSATKPQNPNASPQRSAKDEKDRKGKRKVPDSTGNKQPFTRIWSDDDEIAILKGMVDFTATGKNPTVDKDAFQEFMKKSLQIEVTRNQLMEKITRMKKKFQTNLKRKGEEPNFSKPHDKVAYDLSKKIWGKNTVAQNGNNVAEANAGESTIVTVKPGAKQRNAKEEKLDLAKAVAKSPTKGPKADDEVVEHPVDFSQFSELLDVKFDESFLKKGFSLIEHSKVKTLAERLKKLRKMEAALNKEKAALISDQIALIADAINASED